MKPITITITARDILVRAKANTSHLGPVRRQRFLQEKAEEGLRFALGIQRNLTAKQVARILGVHVNTVKNYNKQGRFRHAFYCTSRLLRIPYRDVENLIANPLIQDWGF